MVVIVLRVVDGRVGRGEKRGGRSRCSAGLPEPEESEVSAILHWELLQERSRHRSRNRSRNGPGIVPEIGPREVPK